MMEQEEKFISGCIKNGIVKSKAVEIFELIKPFAAYGFNKAHAASYGLVAYQTAYLKAHYPAAYMAALMTAESNDADKIADAINECEDIGIEVTLPDINESFSTFAVVRESLKTTKPRIRFGLVAIKNIGVNIVKAIVAEREENGKFKNLADFLYRIQNKDLNRKSVESLIKAGALDCFGDRGQMFGNLEKILNYIKEAHSEGKNGQISLFVTMQEDVTPKLTLDVVVVPEKKQLLLWEKELLGLYVSEHPFNAYVKALKGLVVPCEKLSEYRGSDKDIMVAGMITSVKRIMTKKGDPMLFVKIEDQTKDIEIIVFPKLYQKNSAIWAEDSPVVISGKVSTKDADTKILANKVFKLELDSLGALKKESIFSESQKNESNAQDLTNYNMTANVSEKLVQKLVISLPNLNNLELQKKLKTILTSHVGENKVLLKIGEGDSVKKIETGFLVEIGDLLKMELRGLEGVGLVEVI